MLNIGSRDQRVLNRSGDDLRIDWGYFHLAVPASEQAGVAASSQRDCETFSRPARCPLPMTWICRRRRAIMRRISPSHFRLR